MISKLLGGLFALIGYVSTATVITAVVGGVYLWKTDRLNNEKMFRMVALFHDVDLNKMAEAQRKSTDQVPPEEVSLDMALRRQQVTDRNFEVKLLALKRGRQEYDHSLQSLKDQIDRYDRMAQDWEHRLTQQEQVKSQENFNKVVEQMEMLRPQQGKDELLRWLDQDRMDDAILLMSKISEKKLKSILQLFTSDKELARLHEIHQHIIDSNQQASNVKDALDELKTLGNGK